MPRATPQQWINSIGPTSFYIEEIARSVVEQRVNDAKDDLLADVINDKVSVEIASGPNAPNSSNTLNGYGNLFSFLGFNVGSTPISDLTTDIEKTIRVYKSKPKKMTLPDGTITYSFRVRSFGDTDVESSKYNTPWGPNWILAIIEGMPNFSYYLSKPSGAKNSRSGTGVQIKHMVNRALKSNKPHSYIYGYLKKFRKKLGQTA
jgi:hypothetical protein